MTKLVESIAGIYNMQTILDLYNRNSKPIQKSEPEIKDESIKVKPPLPAHCGNNVDIYA